MGRLVLQAENMCEATVANLLDIYQNHSFELQLELAGMLDLEPLVTATYKLEGDRLEVLLAYDMVEELRTFGGSLDESETTGLVNSAAVARNNHTIAVGSNVREYFGAPYNDWFTGRVLRMPTGTIDTIRIRYSDGAAMECAVEEVRNNIDVTTFPAWAQHVTKLREAFTYLENRLTNNTAVPYHCECSRTVAHVRV